MEELNEHKKEQDVRPIWRKLKTWIESKTSLTEEIMPVEDAYCKSTYGFKMDVKTLILQHQHQINKLITRKTEFKTYGDTFGDYFCIYSFPDNIVPYIDAILEPFKKKGYDIINLSDRVDEYKDYNVYSISWIKNNL